MNIQIKDIIEIINVVPEILLIVFFFHRMFKKNVSLFTRVIVYSVAFIVLSIASIYVPYPYIRIGITFFILLSSSMILYDEALIIKFFASIFYILIIFISETLFVGILALNGFGEPTALLDSNSGRFIGMIGTKILDFWLLVYSTRIYNNKVKSLPLNYWILIILMPFISAIVTNQLFLITTIDSLAILQYAVVVIGLLYLNFSVFNYFESYDKQIKLATLEQLMENENQNYQALVGSYNEIRTIKHDLKNQVTVLNNLIKNHKYDEAEQHIRDLYSDVEKVTSVCYTGNPAVDSIINLKGDYARNCGISFMAKIKVNNIQFDTVGLCRILGNALDNAVEACERMSNGEKYICIALSQYENKLIIEVENTSEYVDTDNMTTSKVNKKIHGIGLQSIIQTAHQMNGNVIYDYQDGFFSMKIVLVS